MNVEKQQMQEKLVELLQHDNCPLFMVFGDKVDVLADYLIAHGVTVQEWISVKDRLPEHGEICLVYSTYEQTDIRQFDSVEMMWVGENLYDNFRMSQVTHWLPLPQPPKGE